LMSSSDGFPYAYDKKDDYISPIQIWIKEACNNIGKPWHNCIPHPIMILLQVLDK
jgi:hypothetical protein